MRTTAYACLGLATFLAALSACSSESEPGEACDVPGGTVDVCERGTVCGRPSEKSNALVCIFTCFEDKDCPRDSDCKGVEGTSVKGCRFKD
jgi:hypothetical protein